jgi:Domain of unknown function (DUF1939).
MQREGYEGQPGLVFVLNNHGDKWSGASVKTKWNNARFIPGAWRGSNIVDTPEVKWTQAEGWGEFSAPPRGYTVYLPQMSGTGKGYY